MESSPTDFLLKIKSKFNIVETSPGAFYMVTTRLSRSGQIIEQKTYYRYNDKVIAWSSQPNKISVYEVENNSCVVFLGMDDFAIVEKDDTKYITHKFHNKLYHIDHKSNSTKIFHGSSVNRDHQDHVRLHTTNLTTIDHLIKILDDIA